VGYDLASLDKKNNKKKNKCDAKDFGSYTIEL
jgi:hypothetical protein